MDNPFDKCPKAGHAAHGDGVKFKIVNDTTRAAVPEATYFMTYHTILKSSQDYIDAMEEARIIAKNITEMLNAGKEIIESHASCSKNSYISPSQFSNFRFQLKLNQSA